jgi:hypothetical protein
MPQGIVISLEILAIGMGDRGSKSVLCGRKLCNAVKEQRVDGSSDSRVLVSVRCTLVAGKAGSWKKLNNSRLKISQ